jgi:CRISPR-associated protein Csc1
LAEPVFFASRELSDAYLTEGVLGNYALAYALGWARAPYRLEGDAVYRPRYQADLAGLGAYVLPAWPLDGSARYRFERFNALSDAYWYKMTNNRVATAREQAPAEKAGERPSEFRPSNYPQAGRFRMLDRGQTFRTLAFGEGETPTYIRVGKFDSKVRVTCVAEHAVEALPEGEYTFEGFVNPADLPVGVRLLRYDLLRLSPVPLMRRVRFQGPAWRIGEDVVPAGLAFLAGNGEAKKP